MTVFCCVCLHICAQTHKNNSWHVSLLANAGACYHKQGNSSGEGLTASVVSHHSFALFIIIFIFFVLLLICLAFYSLHPECTHSEKQELSLWGVEGQGLFKETKRSGCQISSAKTGLGQGLKEICHIVPVKTLLTRSCFQKHVKFDFNGPGGIFRGITRETHSGSASSSEVLQKHFAFFLVFFLHSEHEINNFAEKHGPGGK